MSLFSNPPLASQKDPQASASPMQQPAPTTGALTEADVKKALPLNLRTAVTQSLVDKINNISADPIISENIRNNFVGYSAILKEGKFKTEDYIHAVAYVSYKLMGYNNEESYSRAFPTRYQTLLSKGTSKKDIGAYVSAYHRGKLVNLIMEQSLVPSWVLNQDIYQRAINVQADLMVSANSEKVRSDAANSLLTHLKKPEAKDFQISIDANESSGLKEMREMMGQLASQQRDLIESGRMKTIDVAAARLIHKDKEEDITDV